MLVLPTPRLQQGVLALFVWLLQLVGEHRVKAGNCWLQQGSNGRCQVLYQSGMSRDACCRSARLGSAWTEEDVPNSTLFRWMIFNGGAPNCISCKDSCDSVDCGPGKRCKMTKRNKPRCVCSPNCANTTARGPVCGSDGKSYRDQCSLLRARCRNQPDLQAQYNGRCKKSCRGVSCPGASSCVIDQTNAAYCVTCNLLCPETLKPEQALCGNDGVTYASPCHLRRATCLQGKSIGVAYHGPCIEASSCADITCVTGKRCLWDEESRHGRCVECNDEPCPAQRPGETVCASDNNSYPSECSMRKAACSLGHPLEIKHHGSCNCLQ